MPTHTRTRTGCFTCREDGYKCDEQKPHCGRCLRLAKTCKGYGVRLKWHTPATPATTARAGAGSGSGSRAKTKTAASQSRRANTGRQSLAESSRSPTSPSPSPLSSCPPSSSPSHSPNRSQHGGAGRAAALAPRCLPTHHPLSLVTPSYLPPETEPSTGLLLHHWTRNLASVLSVAAGGSERNPFLVHLTPMLQHSEALRAVVCSMAACHLAVLRSHGGRGGGEPPDPEAGRLFRTMAWRQRLLAASQLRHAVAQDAAEPSLAAILMLQVSDRLFTTSDAKIDHLAGARAVVMKHGGGGLGSLAGWTRSSTSVQFLLSLCYYHDVLSSVSRGTSPLFEFDDSLPMEGLEAMRTLTKVLRLVAQISAMRGLNAEARARRGQEIEEELKGTGERGNEGDELDDDDGDGAKHTTLAYKHAAFIYLERVWHHSAGALASHSTTSAPDAPTPFVSHAKRCLHHLACVPSSSPLLSAHMWPLWTAGCESIDAEGRRFVLDRLDAMFAARHFPSLLRAKRDIQDVWLAKDAQREQVGVDNVDCIKLILQRRQREADLA